jgi:hypothetical protein
VEQIPGQTTKTWWGALSIAVIPYVVFDVDTNRVTLDSMSLIDTSPKPRDDEHCFVEPSSLRHLRIQFATHQKPPEHQSQNTVGAADSNSIDPWWSTPRWGVPLDRQELHHEP